jgi:hypothetical protein
MEAPIKNISLSFPCREDWDKMEVVPGGRLCKSCVHIVRDFRDCTMSELQEASKSGQRVCGRFRKDQLSPGFLKAAVVALSLTPAVACEPETATPQVPQSSEEVMEEDSLDGEIFLGEVISMDSAQEIKARLHLYEMQSK